MQKTPPRVVDRTVETAPPTRPVVVLVTPCMPRLIKDMAFPTESSFDVIRYAGVSAIDMVVKGGRLGCLSWLRRVAVYTK